MKTKLLRKLRKRFFSYYNIGVDMYGYYITYKGTKVDGPFKKKFKAMASIKMHVCYRCIDYVYENRKLKYLW